MKILCVIPSRIGSTRLHRKPLVEIQGKPMVQWVYENAVNCPVIDKVIVATDSEDIAALIHQCGGKAVMTDPKLATGTDRVAVVAQQHPEMDIIINLQGDEPFIKPHMLEILVSPYLVGENPEMITLAYPLDMKTKYFESGSVKVITDLHRNAIYFSRAPIPYFRNEEKVPVYNHMGVYAFTREFLSFYSTLPQTPLEKVEALEQLRVLEHGHKIRVCLIKEKTLEINTPEELAEAQLFQF